MISKSLHIEFLLFVVYPQGQSQIAHLFVVSLMSSESMNKKLFVVESGKLTL